MSAVAYVLTISGSDSSGCAGMQADNRAILASGAYPLNVITANTLQTPDGVESVELVEAAVVGRQVERILQAYSVCAVKIGMLGAGAIVQAVAEALSGFSELPVVLDPVLVSSSGQSLLNLEAVQILKHELLPHVTLLTPNLAEAAVLGAVDTCAVLLKGGHAAGDVCEDVLRMADGAEHRFRSKRVASRNTRGTGCALSAGIAARLALGHPMEIAVRESKAALQASLEANIGLDFEGAGAAFW